MYLVIFAQSLMKGTLRDLENNIKYIHAPQSLLLTIFKNKI